METVLYPLLAALGALCGWFVHRRYDDLKGVREDIKSLEERVRNIEIEFVRRPPP